jgi:hypothetical protein
MELMMLARWICSGEHIGEGILMISLNPSLTAGGKGRVVKQLQIHQGAFPSSPVQRSVAGRQLDAKPF